MKNQKHTDAKPKSQTMAKQNINNKKKYKKNNSKENETNQPWKYSYEEEKFSSGGGPWTLPNLSMISWRVCFEFVYNFQLGNTITNTRYIYRAFPPIVQ